MEDKHLPLQYMKYLIIAAALFLLPYMTSSFLPWIAHYHPVLRNGVPASVTKIHLFGNPKEQSNGHKMADLEGIIDVAYYSFMEQQEAGVLKLYKEHPDWHNYFFDSVEGELCFKDDDEKIVAHTKVQLIGTYGKTSNTFMWAWAHHHAEGDLPEEQLQTVLKLKAIGELFKFQNLTEPVLYECDEEYAWKLTAYALWTTNAFGAFRIDSGPCWWYMTLEDLIIIEEEEEQHITGDA